MAEQRPEGWLAVRKGAERAPGGPEGAATPSLPARVSPKERESALHPRAAVRSPVWRQEGQAGPFGGFLPQGSNSAIKCYILSSTVK